MNKVSPLSFTPKTETPYSVAKTETLDKGKYGSDLVKGDTSQKIQMGEKDEIKCFKCQGDITNPSALIGE